MALLKFSPEEQRALESLDCCLDIPRNTKPAVARRYHENLKALAAKIRGLAPVLEARGSRTKRMTKADIRAVFATVPGASLEELARWRRNCYSLDTQNALRMAEITKQIRYEQGQTADPTQSLRDDDDAFDWDDDDQWDKDEHERCAEFHRALARKSDTWQKGAAQHTAADLHDKASRGGDSRAARAASLKLADIS
ncbi:MAG: hypothetical protein WBF04_24155 [Candidatus Sulfotelmatobacter sp.]